MLATVQAAANVPKPDGLGMDGSEKHAKNYFGFYGIDMMLTDKLAPVLLEVNFSPDCTRACAVYRLSKF